jgi:hypothetical protein
MGGDGAWDHINSCPCHSANWSITHEHVFSRSLETVRPVGRASSLGWRFQNPKTIS